MSDTIRQVVPFIKGDLIKIYRDLHNRLITLFLTKDEAGSPNVYIMFGVNGELIEGRFAVDEITGTSEVNSAQEVFENLDNEIVSIFVSAVLEQHFTKADIVKYHTQPS